MLRANAVNAVSPLAALFGLPPFRFLCIQRTVTVESLPFLAVRASHWYLKRAATCWEHTWRNGPENHQHSPLDLLVLRNKTSSRLLFPFFWVRRQGAASINFRCQRLPDDGVGSMKSTQVPKTTTWHQTPKDFVQGADRRMTGTDSSWTPWHRTTAAS